MTCEQTVLFSFAPSPLVIALSTVGRFLASLEMSSAKAEAVVYGVAFSSGFPIQIYPQKCKTLQGVGSRYSHCKLDLGSLLLFSFYLKSCLWNQSVNTMPHPSRT